MVVPTNPVDTGQADEWVYGTGEPLTAVVAEEYEGLLVPLVYEHPVAGIDRLAAAIESSLAELAECFETQGDVDRAGATAWGFLAGGGDRAELIAALRELDGQFLAYVISFFVLGLRCRYSPCGPLEAKRDAIAAALCGTAGASVVPRNTLTVQIAPLNFAFETIAGNERMNIIMNHELVHVATMDQAAGADRVFRRLFGGKVMPIREQPESANGLPARTLEMIVKRGVLELRQVERRDEGGIALAVAGAEQILRGAAQALADRFAAAYERLWSDHRQVTK